MCVRARRGAREANDALDREILALAGTGLEEMHVAAKLGRAQVSLMAKRLVDGPGDLGMHEQRHARPGEQRHGLAKVVLIDMWKVVDTRGNEEALEGDATRVQKGAGARPALPGTRPPVNATSTKSLPSVAAAFASNAARVVVGGEALSGMSTSVVTPPAAAARVAVSKPSQCERPGSLMSTWVSTRPGRRTPSPASSTIAPGGVGLDGRRLGR